MEMENHERASHELRADQAANLKTRAKCFFSVRHAEYARTGAIAENAAIELRLRRGTLCPTYRKPFDLFAKGLKLEIGSPHWTISATG
jgi:hypothetical protein